jgi:GT2 family glycosyltransferase
VTAVLARAAPGRVRHLPEILARQPGAPAEGAPPLPPDWPERALAFWPEIAAGRARRTALPGAPWLGRVRRPLPEPAPRVAVLIPTRDRVELLSRAVDTLTGMTDYPALEPIVLDNATTCPRARAYLADLPGRGVRVLDCPGPFNFAAINNRGVAATDADLVCLLNNDVEITEPGWLAEMVSALARPEIGAVGAKLLWDTGMVQHAGVVLGIDGGAAHAGPLWAAEDRGYCGANRLARRVSAVTAACLLLRRADYRAVGGMDADAFPVNFNDVDLCMKLGALGKAVLWTPHALMLHHESASRGRDALPARAARARRELEMLRRRWGRTLLADPYYNPNLTRRGEPYAGLALPPAPATPR